MSRNDISTRAQDYSSADLFDDAQGDSEELDAAADIQVGVPRHQAGKSREARDKVVSTGSRHCDARPRRVLKDGRPAISESFTTDQYGEEAKQRRLQERVRELASRAPIRGDE
jgi:hypothetical protein